MRIVGYGITLIILIIVLRVVFGRPDAAELSLNSGDIRYYYFGLPLKYSRMPEPQRTDIVTVTSPLLKGGSEWAYVPVERTSSDSPPITRFRLFYSQASAWKRADPAICKFIFQDIMDAIHDRRWTDGGIPALRILEYSDVFDANLNRVMPGWKVSTSVQDYCQSHSYTPSGGWPSSFEK